MSVAAASLRRNREACESRVLVRPIARKPQTSRSSSSFVKTRVGCSASLTSSSYSLAGRWISRPRTRTQRVGEDDGAEFGDLIADRYAEDPEQAAVDGVRGTAVRRALANLPERERQVVELRFGLNDAPISLEAIGRELGLTRERVRQLEASALRKLEAILGDELALAA